MRTIGIISSYLSGSFLGEMYRFVLASARQKRVRIVGLRAGDQDRTYDNPLATELCDGWLLMTRVAHPRFIQRLTSAGRPMCSIGEETGVPGCGLVQSDNRLGVIRAMEELQSCGHQNFAFIGNPLSSDIRERQVAFQGYLQEHNLPAEADRIQTSTDFGLSGGWSAAEALHRGGRKISALVCGNDQNAAGALQYFRGAGLRVPEDLVLVGYDNAPLASEQRFRLTTLDQQHHALAEAALDDVLARLEDTARAPVKLRVAPRMVFRTTFAGHGPAELDAPVEASGSNDQIWVSSELNRYFYGESTAIHPILQRFRQFGRTLEHFEVQNGQILSREPSANLPTSLETLGKDLLERTKDSLAFVALYPLFTEAELDAILVASFPWEADLTRRSMSLDVAELELTAFAVERFSVKRRLDALLKTRTEELQAARERVVEQAQRSITAHLAGSFAHQLNSPLAAIEASARNLSELVPQLVGAFSGDRPPLTEKGLGLLKRLAAQNRPPEGTGPRRSAVRTHLRTQLQGWEIPSADRLAELLAELAIIDLDDSWRAELAAPDADRVLEIAVTQRMVLLSAEVVNQASQKAAEFTLAMTKAIDAPLLGSRSERLNLGVLVETLVTLIRASWSTAHILVHYRDRECWVEAEQDTLVRALGTLLLPDVLSAATPHALAVEVRAEELWATVEVASGLSLSASAADSVERAVEQLGGSFTSTLGEKPTWTLRLKRV